MPVGDSIRYTLRPKDIEKASELFSVDMAALEQFNSLRLLNTEYIRDVLIRADYERLTSGLHWLEHNTKNYKFPEVLRALELEYNIAPMKIKKILSGKSQAVLFCSKCGQRISRSLHDRTGGLCSNCFAETLGL